jgi:hypothetical protein
MVEPGDSGGLDILLFSIYRHIQHWFDLSFTTTSESGGRGACLRPAGRAALRLLTREGLLMQGKRYRRGVDGSESRERGDGEVGDA